MKDIKLLSKNKYLKVPLLYSGGGGNVPAWRRHLQPCEWLESTDELPYIKLSDISTASITYIKAEIETNNLNNKTLFAARQASNSLQLFINNTSKVSCRCFGSTPIDSNIGNGRFTAIIDKTNRLFSVENENYSITNTYGGINQNIYLFGLMSGIWNGTVMKLYNFETNLCNLVACYVKTGQTYTDNKGNLCGSGVAGMVDTLTGVFYTNDGSGQFFHGGDIEI